MVLQHRRGMVTGAAVLMLWPPVLSVLAAGSKLAMRTGKKLLQANDLLSPYKRARPVVSLKLGMCTATVHPPHPVVFVWWAAIAVY